MSEFTEDEIRVAAHQEEIEKLNAQNRYLTSRVVTLRAILNRQQASEEPKNDLSENTED